MPPSVTTYLSLDDSYKFDDVRESLTTGNLQSAAKLGRIFRLKPVTIPCPRGSISIPIAGGPPPLKSQIKS